MLYTPIANVNEDVGGIRAENLHSKYLFVRKKVDTKNSLVTLIRVVVLKNGNRLFFARKAGAIRRSAPEFFEEGDIDFEILFRFISWAVSSDFKTISKHDQNN